MYKLGNLAEGIAAAGIAGGANGVITGFAAVGIDPGHFNLQAGLHSTLNDRGRQRPSCPAIIGIARVFETVAAAERAVTGDW